MGNLNALLGPGGVNAFSNLDILGLKLEYLHVNKYAKPVNALEDEENLET